MTITIMKIMVTEMTTLPYVDWLSCRTCGCQLVINTLHRALHTTIRANKPILRTDLYTLRTKKVGTQQFTPEQLWEGSFLNQRRDTGFNVSNKRDFQIGVKPSFDAPAVLQSYRGEFWRESVVRSAAMVRIEFQVVFCFRFRCSIWIRFFGGFRFGL